MNKRPLILISNDDGYNAPGINVLISIARQWGDVVVVAPDECQSGKSHAITMKTPLFVTPRSSDGNVTVYSVNGTPVDCIKIALDELLKDTPVDYIFSGINHGSNANISVAYSGTMGAATEGHLYGIPSVGFSLCDHDDNADFTASIPFVEQIIKMVIAMPDSGGLCLNVNIPNLPLDEIKGIEFCRQTRGVWREDFIHRADPRGRDYYWMSGSFYNNEPHSTETDEWALANGYVAIVPVTMDFTDYKRLDQFKTLSLK